MFDFTFASHLTGLMKPDRQAYELVVSTLKVPASEIHFFDDLPANVAAAHEVGINAFVARGPREAEAILLSNGLLSHAGPYPSYRSSAMHIDGVCHCGLVSFTAELIIRLGCVKQRAEFLPSAQI